MAGFAIYADIALQSPRYARQIAAWTLFRDIDIDGQGWLSRKSAMQLIQEYLPGGKGSLSAPSRRRILRAGEGVFWHITRSHGRAVIFYRSPDKVCRALGIKCVRDGDRMDLDELAGPIGDVRARLAIRAVARIRRERPTSNAAMHKMVGVSTRTIKTYKRRSEVLSVECYEIMAPYTRARWHDYWTNGGPQFRVVRFRNKRWICRQIGSALKWERSGGVRSRLRRVNRALRSCDFPGRGHPQRCPSTSRCSRPDSSLSPPYQYVGRGRKTGADPGAARLFSRAA